MSKAKRNKGVPQWKRFIEEELAKRKGAEETKPRLQSCNESTTEQQTRNQHTAAKPR